MWRLAAYSPVFLLPIIFWVANFVRPDHETADDYKDNWLQSDWLQSDGFEKSDGQKSADQWAMIMHAKFTKRQGQVCVNLCVLCDHVGQKGELTTVSIARAKSARDLLKTSVIAPVDTVLGTAKGAIVGAQKGMTDSLETSVDVGGWFAGDIADGAFVGPLSLIPLGFVTPVLLTHAELKGLLTGLNHGIGMVKKFTKCGRVGFDGNTQGHAIASQPWHSSVGGDYGLKKLRSWNAENAEKNPELRGDADATRHCERLRDQSFDMRHAMDCVKHSKICGGTGVVLPIYNADTCRKMSSKEDLKQYIEKQGILNGLFSAKTNEKKRILEDAISILTEVNSHEATLEHPADDAEKPALLEQCDGETEDIDSDDSDSVSEKTKQTEEC